MCHLKATILVANVPPNISWGCSLSSSGLRRLLMRSSSRHLTRLQVQLKVGLEGLQDAFAVPEGVDAQITQVLMPHAQDGIKLHILALKDDSIRLQARRAQFSPSDSS